MIDFSKTEEQELLIERDVYKRQKPTCLSAEIVIPDQT